MMPRSAIYDGVVMHQRLRPKRHRLRYQVFCLLLDLDELPALDRRVGLFGFNRPAPISFFNRDHGPTTDEPLRPWAEACLRDAGLTPDGGPIRLLCYPRIFGFTFNPLSTYFCYRQCGALQAVLYEVCNTFKERHTYIIPVDDQAAAVVRQRCSKSLYVSPFNGMEADYHFRIVPPGADVRITIRQEDTNGLLLAAAFRGVRQNLTTGNLARMLVRFPFMTFKIVAAIHWEAFLLWLKGMRVVDHKPAAQAVASSVAQPPFTRT